MIKNKIKHIVLTPGHGGGDSGAVSNSGRQEAQNVVKLCKYIVELQAQYTMSKVRFSVLDAENRLGLAQSIAEMNKNFNFPWKNGSQDNYLLIEVHQDMNAPHLPLERQKWQIGTYRYENDQLSQEFASEFVEKTIQNGAYAGTADRADFDGGWQKGHYLPWLGYHLGFINNTKALSIILECGYISAEHTDEELKKLAFIIYSSFYEMFENKKMVTNNNQNNNENMLKIKLIETINKSKIFSQTQKNDLIYAINSDNYNDVYAIIRWNEEAIKEKENKIIELTNQLSQANSQIVPVNQSINNFTADSIDSVKRINAVDMSSRIAQDTYTVRTSNKSNFFDKFTGIFKNSKVIDSTNELINESQNAIKTKSYKRFTVTLIYFLFTIGTVILNSVFPDLQFANDLKNYLDSPLVLTLLTSLTGGYISMQTLTDILRKK